MQKLSERRRVARLEQSNGGGAGLGAAVLDPLRRPDEKTSSWVRLARAGGAEITPDTPLDVARIQMADKFAQKEYCELLPPSLADAITHEVRIRRTLAAKAVERCLRVKLYGAFARYVHRTASRGLPAVGHSSTASS